MSNAVFIPIKTINERLPGKNTRPLKGRPLYEWLFKTLEGAPCVHEVFVDSSDAAILEIARTWGFTPLERPVAFNGNTITGDDLLMRVVDGLPHDTIALLHVTSPFLTAASIQRGFEMLAADASLDSVFGVLPIYNRLWFQGRPVNHDIQSLKRTQDLPPVHEETDVYFMRQSSLRTYGKRVCGKFDCFEMTKVESTDLDDLADFVRAEAYIEAGLVDHPFTAGSGAEPTA